MAIELAPTKAPPKSTQAVDSKSDFDKAVEPEQNDPSGASAFMAILVAMDASVPVDATLAPEPLPQIDPLMDSQAGTEVPMDAAALLAQSMQWVQPQLDDKAVPVATPARLPADNVRNFAQGASILPQGSGAGGKAQIPGKTSKSPGDVAAAQATFSAALGGTVQSNGRIDAQALQAPSKYEATLTAAATAETTVVTATLPRREELVHDRSIMKMVAAEGVLTPQASMAAPTPGTVVADASAVASPLDVYVAEQVKFWVSNDVQKAEMKLDGIGEHPVEVSITMQGNEAHVVFRSDEVQAREALESASAHLREMLQSEGLILSGVSVGTSGAGDSDAQQQRKARAETRQAAVASVPVPSMDAISTPGRTTGRALDLFV